MVALQPIFGELEDTGHNLNEEEFIDAAYRLYDALAPPQRKMLFNPKKATKQANPHQQHRSSSQRNHRGGHQSV